MRLIKALALSALVCFVPASPTAAQGVGVSVGLRLGNERVVAAYSPERYGEWRANYKRWKPTTLYVVNGHYYDKYTRGSRAVVVYRRGGEYFLPPQDSKWVGYDRRYNYRRRPNDEDYRRP